MQIGSRPGTHFYRAGLWGRIPGHASVTTSLGRDEPHRLALTFDDGPDPAGTPPVLDALGAVGARATFFVLIEAARAEPGLIDRIVGEGHTLGLHADVHERLDRSPRRELGARLAGARRELEDLAGRPVRLHRPPFGAVSRGSLRAAHAAGLNVVLWSHDPKDWQETAPDALAVRISGCLEPGAVVALHDGPTDGRPIGTTTAPALESIATELRRYRLVGL